MMETELKPCPFCGGVAIAEMCNIAKEFRIYCEECPAKIGLSYGDAQLDDGSFISFREARKIMDELEELWNARATDGKAEAD